MCHRINKLATERASAYFRKGNEPEHGAYWFDVEAAPCQCGKMWYVKPKGLSGWIEATKESKEIK